MKSGLFKIFTLGCKVNQYESAFIKDSLIRAGWGYARKGQRADLYIINTCIVTQRASYQSRQSIRRAIRENPSAKTVAVGCYGQVFPEELRDIDGLTLITGNMEKGRLSGLIESLKETPETIVHSGDFPRNMGFEFLQVGEFLDRTRAFLKIQDGCESFCSYCIVPFSRGPIRSLEPEKILMMMRGLAEQGYREVVLTGIHLGKYGIDLGMSRGLKDLLLLINKEDLPIRVRLSSLEPTEIDEHLIGMIGDEERLCPHLHIPLQSGDDRILKKMNRSYATSEFARVINRIHSVIPDAAIGLDIMAGFPGEDDSSFLKGYSFVEELPISYLHVFPYSPRNGTPAAGFPSQVRQDVVKERAKELRMLGDKKRLEFHGSMIGKNRAVLAEGWESRGNKIIKGLSDNYIRVHFPSDRLMKNELTQVRIEKAGQDHVVGRVIDE